MTIQQRKVQIGSTLRVWVGTPEEIDRFAPAITQEIEKGLNQGKTVREGQTSQWIAEVEVYDHSKSGSAAYVWRGDKVKVERFLVTRTGDEVTRKSIGFAWRAPL